MNNKILYLFYRLFSSPLEAIFTLLIFILSKELHATPFQLTVLACLKPVMSLVAFNVNAVILGKTQRIKPFLMSLCMLGALPCWFFPFVTSPWYFIGAYGLFMACFRGANPAWIEILKSDLGRGGMTHVAATGSAINYTVVIFIPLVLSHFMDSNPTIWTLFFVLLGSVQLLNLLVISQIKLPNNIPFERTSFYWKESLQILRTNRPFLHYQMLFFLGGIGMVTVQPILPIYFNETLHLSYTQLALAFSVCKGIAFVFSSPFWARYAPSITIYFLNTWINLFSTLFVAFMLGSYYDTNWIFVAFLMFGAMQAGTEMTFNLSGPTFAKEKESTLHSSINHAFIGIRGCICPFLGQLIFTLTNAIGVFIFCAVVSLFSVFYALYLDRLQKRSEYVKNFT